MPDLDSIINKGKELAEEAKEKAEGAAEVVKEKVGEAAEELTGKDLDGDGVVGDGDGQTVPDKLGAAVGKLVDKAEELTGKDLDGDGQVGA